MTLQAHHCQLDRSIINSSRGEETLGRVPSSFLSDTVVVAGGALGSSPKPPSVLVSANKTQRKTVSFSPHTPTAVSFNSEITDKERIDSWWQRNEFKSIRGKARSLAQRILADREKNDFEYSYACTMDAVFKQARNLSEEEELKLWAWFSKAHARRGLERLSASHVGRNRKAKIAIRKVLKAQKELSNSKIDNGTKSQMLALVSQVETDQARALAQVFGKADMVAATMSQFDA